VGGGGERGVHIEHWKNCKTNFFKGIRNMTFQKSPIVKKKWFKLICTNKIILNSLTFSPLVKDWEVPNMHMPHQRLSNIIKSAMKGLGGLRHAHKTGSFLNRRWHIVWFEVNVLGNCRSNSCNNKMCQQLLHYLVLAFCDFDFDP
jgi:hypothetical protein